MSALIPSVATIGDITGALNSTLMGPEGKEGGRVISTPESYPHSNYSASPFPQRGLSPGSMSSHLESHWGKSLESADVAVAHRRT